MDQHIKIQHRLSISFLAILSTFAWVTWTPKSQEVLAQSPQEQARTYYVRKGEMTSGPNYVSAPWSIKAVAKVFSTSRTSHSQPFSEQFGQWIFARYSSHFPHPPTPSVVGCAPYNDESTAQNWFKIESQAKHPEGTVIEIVDWVPSQIAQ
jgi:hypothetical protein